MNEYVVLIIGCAFLVVIIVLTVLLISNAKKYRELTTTLNHRLELDALTGVYNREHFFQKAQQMIDREEDDIYIVRFNVCHFKLINEIYGVEKGDDLLLEMGRDLKAMGRRAGFIVGRFAADRFYLCIHRKDFESIDLPRRALAPWLGIDITLSYGVYPIKNQKNIPVSAMCDRADMAIVSNEQSPAGHIFFYNDRVRQQLIHDHEIENDMVKAIVEKQFCIYIQPKYDIESETIVGGETLVRWNHPEKGMIMPGSFIGLFERNGFIKELDYYVWEECCRFLADMKQKGLPIYPLSVNVSRIHFYGSELVDKLNELTTRYDLGTDYLELEITENLYSNDPEMIYKKCDELRRVGYKIVMDDFGSGYSSLNMLKEMPLDIIKMDMRFLANEKNDVQTLKGRSILQTLIELARTLDLNVVIEGLETADQKEFVQHIGDCAVQGYYYSMPVSCDNYELMIS